MKVLHIISSLSPLRGGPPEAVFGMVKAQLEIGLEVEVVASNDHGPGLLDVPLFEKTMIRGIPARFFPRWSPPIGPLREFQIAFGYEKWLRAHVTEYDVVHAHGLFSHLPTLGMRIAGEAGVPYLNQPDGLLSQWSMQQKSGRKRLFHRLFERRNLARAGAVHCTLEQEKRETAPWVDARVPLRVVPLGCSEIPYAEQHRHAYRQRRGWLPQTMVFLFLGRIHPKKGLELLFQALARLEESSWKLVVAGNSDPAYLVSLQQLSQQLGIAEQILWLPFVEGEEKAGVLHAADCFVLTSHSENFGITVVESLCLGLPVLVTPGVGLAEEVRQYHFGYVPGFDIAEVARDLGLACEQRESWRGRRAELIQQARQRWSWASAAKGLAAVYEELLKGKTTRT